MMNIVKILPDADGGHDTFFGLCSTPAPEGWARVPDGMELQECWPYVDLTVEDGEDLPVVTGMTPRPDLADKAAEQRAAAEKAAQEEAKKQAEAARQRQEALDKLPQTLEALQKENETLKKESEMLKQCLLEMSETVYA